jgi:cardiolipin synthase
VTEGERWVRELLCELRAARYAPRAWTRFFARSFVRAGEQRRAHPKAHRQALSIGVAGLAPWGALAGAGRPWAAAAGAAWWFGVVLMLDWHLGMLERPDGTRIAGLGVANALSLLRLWAVPALPLLRPEAIAAALVLAGLTDVADGRLARRRDQATRLGTWLDGAADTSLILVAALALPLQAWAATIVVARCAAPCLALTAYYFVRAGPPRGDGYVSGRIPGLVLLAGLLLVALGANRGAELAALGALGGIGTLAASLVLRGRSELPISTSP